MLARGLDLFSFPAQNLKKASFVLCAGFPSVSSSLLGRLSIPTGAGNGNGNVLMRPGGLRSDAGSHHGKGTARPDHDHGDDH